MASWLAVSPTFGHLSIFVGVQAALFLGLGELPYQNNVDN